MGTCYALQELRFDGVKAQNHSVDAQNPFLLHLLLAGPTLSLPHSPMNKDKKTMERMTERILNHALEIMYLLTGEVSLLQHLCNSLILTEVCKDKRIIERILNHALEIICLLTGEEYTIVKKSSPHSSIHQLTVESNITGHNEMDDNHQSVGNAGIPANRSSGLKDENIDLVDEEEDDEIDEKEILQVKIHSDLCAGPSYIKHTGVPNVEKAEDVKGHLLLKKEDMPINISQGVSGENVYAASINEEEEYERAEKAIQKMEIQSHPSTEAVVSSNTCGQQPSSPRPSHFMIKDIGETDIYQGEIHLNNTPYKNRNQPMKKVGKESRLSSRKDHGGKKKDIVRAKKRSKETSQAVEEHKKFSPTRNYSEELGEKTDSYHSQLSVPQRVKETFICSDCGKGFTYRSKLVKHQKWHTKEKSFECSQCGKCFIYSSHLDRHQKSHIEAKPFSCSECGKCFSQKCHLVRHEVNHTGVKPFACAQCGKCFSRKSLLVLHEKIHTGEKPFACSECGKCFTQKSNYNIHRKIHTRVKSFTHPETRNVV